MERARHRKSKSASGIEGNLQIQKAPPRFSTDSLTYIDGSKRDDLFMLELGGSSWRGPTGTPMKKLLAEEMSREVDSRRRPPSIIARLMGLEGLPSPRHVHGPQRRLSDSYQQKSRSLHQDGRASRSPPGPPVFKDVYEDLEAASRRRCSFRSTTNSILTKPELAIIQQKLQASDEMDHVLKNLWHRDSPGNRIAVLKPYETKAKPTGREHFTLRREDGLLLERHGRRRAHRSPSRARVEAAADEEKILPTRIVVLKPNLGKVQSLSRPAPDLMKKSQRRKGLSSDVGLSGPISKEAREIAREITMRMMDRCGDEANDLRSVWARGYAGDESSYEASESDSESEPEGGFRFSLRKASGYPSFSQVESSVNREARKRLSERWRMAHNYQNMEVVNFKGGTLGEMLALPDRETRPGNLNAKASPSGISSRDGWSEEITSNSLRSKSLPPGRRGSRSHKMSSYHDGLTEENGMSKFMKRSISHKEDYLSRCSKSRGKKPHPCQDVFIGEIDSSTGANIEIQMEANIKDISEQQITFDMSENADVSRSPVVDVMMISEPMSTTLSPVRLKIARKLQPSLTDGDEYAIQERGDCKPLEVNKVPTEQASSSSLCPGAEAEPSESSKGANHPSPNSVLEASFAEDASSAESFERVSAELQELRLQLQLLKMESSTDADMATFFPNEEEDAQPSPIVSEGNYAIPPEGWEIHYALDVLITSGLQQELDYSTFETSMYSTDCSLDPKLFDILEKKYNDDEVPTGAKWERKLLFDRINSALMQIFMEHVDPCPWVMPKSRGLNLDKPHVKKLIERLELSEVEMSEKAVDRVMGWAGPRAEVEVVGNEIQRLLMDEMVAEVLLLYVGS